MIRICTEQSPALSDCNKFDTLYAGAVLHTYEINGYDDSDFAAVVWDKDHQVVRSYTYASTSSWTYHNHARVDAAEDVLTAAQAWLAVAVERRLVAAAADPAVDRHVCSLTTRGRAAGLTGTVRHLIPDRYRRGGTRAGIKPDGGGPLVWVDAGRLRVDTEPDLTAIAAQAATIARGRDFLSAVRGWRR